MEAFFETGWVYLAHESQVSQPNDYQRVWIGRQPVILVRTEDGTLHGLLNRCMHRGATVCRSEAGNSARFRCFYHGWTYRNSGELVGVPDRAGYAPDFDLDGLALRRVARVESYRGFVFGSLDPDTPPLAEHLGNARPYLDAIVGKYPGGVEIARGTTPYGYQGNWKLQVENALDFYHLPTTHKSFLDVMKAKGVPVPSSHRLMEGDNAVYLGNGHGTVVSRTYDADGHSHVDSEQRRALEERFGAAAAPLAGSIHQHLLIFPNLVILEHPGPQIRVIRPLAVDRTEVRGYAYFPKGVPDHVRRAQLRAYEVFYGPAGMGTPDDIEAFDSCTEGYRAGAAPWNDLSRGMHREATDLDLAAIGPFETAGNITDDTVYRGLYRWWVGAMCRGLDGDALRRADRRHTDAMTGA
nr:Rieske 2Fe-2S domain-containing protein [Pseudonocardia acidicola]